jgi:hypothetical protein
MFFAKSAFSLLSSLFNLFLFLILSLRSSLLTALPLRCITKRIVQASACPKCAAPTLLYSLFRLRLDD